MLRKICLVLLINCFYLTGFTDQIKDRDLAGQLLFVGIHGHSFSKSIKSKITNIRPGGIILFGSNIKTHSRAKMLIKKINAHYDKIGTPRPFIAVDQEGGYVTRVKTKPLLPSPALLGHHGDEEKVREISYYNSKLLRSIGFNMNFSPVLDIQSNGGNEFLGSRSFSMDANAVGSLGERVVEGANEALVLSTAKHFPGHGDVSGDSHKTLPVSNKSIPQLLTKEVIPYKKMIEDNKLPAIMIGHIAFPAIDETGLPSSFSKKIIDGFLKKKLGFKGLVVTDDIQMKAANISPDTKFRTRLALDAGVDMVMLAWNSKSQMLAYQKIYSDLKNDSKFRKQTQAKVKNILRLKKQYSVLKKSYYEETPRIWKSTAKLQTSIKKLFDKLDYKSVHNNYLKTKTNYRNQPIIVFSKYKSFFRSLSKRANEKRSLFFQLTKRFNVKKLKQLLRKFPNSPIYFQVSNKAHSRLLSLLSKAERDKVFIINSRSKGVMNAPWSIEVKTNLPEVGNYLANYYVRSGHKKRAVANARPYKSKNKK